MNLALRFRLLLAVLLAVAITATIAGVAALTTGSERTDDRAECHWVWVFNPYPHDVWWCNSGGGGGGSW